MIDTHSHIYLDNFQEDLEGFLARAKEAGIGDIYMPNIDSSSIGPLKKVAQEHPHCLPMMGLHPGSVKENWEEELAIILKEIDENSGYYKAIGEIGLDLYWDTTFIEAQKQVFTTQIQKAKELGLPIVIHCREAFDEIFEILDKEKDEKLYGIFHCFTGNAQQAEHAISLNMKLGIGGVVTFKNAGLDKTVEQTDVEHLVLETDAPYLSPVPKRGKPNEPSYLKYTAEKIAKLKGLSLEELDRITTQNAQQVFNR